MVIAAWIIAVQFITYLLLYPLMVTGKRADEELMLMLDENSEKVRKGQEEKEMESQREVVRMIENEIRKGSAPVHFQRMAVTPDSYRLVESQAKMSMLLDYFFRLGTFAKVADRQVKSNVYMDAAGKNPDFRMAKSELDRRSMEAAAKRWIKKKNPSYDGDVYVESVRCYLQLDEEVREKQKCAMDKNETTLLIFSKKHLTGLYLQCLNHRREMTLKGEVPQELSEISSRIYRLDEVDVLFQCLLMDNMEWAENMLCIDFVTVFKVERF